MILRASHLWLLLPLALFCASDLHRYGHWLKAPCEEASSLKKFQQVEGEDLLHDYCVELQCREHALEVVHAVDIESVTLVYRPGPFRQHLRGPPTRN